MKKVALVLVLIAVAGLLTGLFFIVGSQNEAAAVEPTATTEEPAIQVPPDEIEKEDEASVRNDAVEEATRTAILPSAASAFPDAVEEATALWIEGRVVFPEGAPDDDLLHVYCLSQPFEHDGFAERIFAVQHALRGSREREPNEGEARDMKRISSALFARRPVAADGSFRVPADHAADKIYLNVEGRYLFLRESVRVDLESKDPIELDLSVGAQLNVQVTAPAEIDPEAANLAGTEIEINIIATSTNPSDYDRALTIDFPIELFEDGGFELHAVPLDYGLQLDAKPETWAGSRTLVEDLQPGERRAVDIALTLGGIVQGEVHDPDGAPVAEAKVEMMLRGNWFGFDDKTVREGITDELGRFEISGITPGKLALKADHSNFLESSRVSVEVFEGETIEAPPVKLTRGNNLSGKVVDKAGAPVANAKVIAEFDPSFLMGGPSAFNALRGAEGETKSDEEGNFTIRALGAGPFVVRAIHSAEEIDLDAEDESAPRVRRARQERVYPKAKDLVLVLHPPIELAGVVTDGEENPVPEFTVATVRESKGAMGNVPMETRTESFENDDGQFSITNMTEGSWKVQVRAPGFITAAAVSVALPRPAADGPLTLELVPTVKVSGVVLGPMGKSVPNARVRVAAEGPSWQSAFVGGETTPSTTANESGNFIFDDLAPGSLTLHAEAEGFAPGASQLFELSPGDSIEDVELRVALGGTLTGLAYDQEGELAGGRFITLYSSEMEQVIGTTDGAGEFKFENMTPGSWQIIGMDRQSNFGANEDGGMSGLDGMQVAQADIVEGETTHVVLGAPPADPVKVYGRVTHDGEPYKGGIVTFFPQGTPLYERMVFTQVDEKGYYELTIDGPGDYVVIVQRMGRIQTQQQNVEFTREIPLVTEHKLDFQVPLGRISGTVTGADGKPAVGARVTLSSDGGFRSDALLGGQYAEIETDAEGRYDLVGLRPGTYMLASGGAPLIHTGGEVPHGRVTMGGVKLGEDEWKRDLDLRLKGPGNIEVTVIGGDGQPVRGAGVFFRDSEGRVTEPFNFATTDSVGRFTGRGLGVGDYTLSARLGNAASDKSPVIRVVEGETAKVELRLDDGVILWIKLKDREKQDVRASLRVLDEDGHDWGAMFGMEDLQVLYGDGGFSPTEHRLGPLPPGKYKVYAKGKDGKSATKPVRIKQGELERRLTLRLK